MFASRRSALSELSAASGALGAVEQLATSSAIRNAQKIDAANFTSLRLPISCRVIPVSPKFCVLLCASGSLRVDGKCVHAANHTQSQAEQQFSCVYGINASPNI